MGGGALRGAGAGSGGIAAHLNLRTSRAGPPRLRAPVLTLVLNKCASASAYLLPPPPALPSFPSPFPASDPASCTPATSSRTAEVKHRSELALTHDLGICEVGRRRVS